MLLAVGLGIFLAACSPTTELTEEIMTREANEGEARVEIHTESKHAPEKGLYWEKTSIDEGDGQVEFERYIDQTREYFQDGEIWDSRELAEGEYEEIIHYYPYGWISEKIIVQPNLFDLKSEEGQYVFTYESDDPEMIKTIRSDMRLNKEDMADLNFSDFKFAYTVDSKTLKPIIINIYSLSEEDGISIIEERDIKIIEINEDFEFSMPEDIKALGDTE